MKLPTLAFSMGMMIASASAFVPPIVTFGSTFSNTVGMTSLHMASNISPAAIKDLRDATGAGMMDCKKALMESDGDRQGAVDYLRANGLAKADKKANRVTTEGRIVTATSGNKAVLVEINCETDFVASDDNFVGFCNKVADTAINVDGDSVEDLMNVPIDGKPLETMRKELVARLGENIQVRRIASRGKEGTTVGAYVHLNNVGAIVELEGGDETLCKDIAMHVVAMNPPYAIADDVPEDVLQKEREIFTEQASASGKPPAIIEKMVGGRLRKYLEEVCLVSQEYIKEPGMKVDKFLKEKGAKMIGFSRISVGEGIEKEETDFASEVAKLTKGL